CCAYWIVPIAQTILVPAAHAPAVAPKNMPTPGKNDAKVQPADTAADGFVYSMQLEKYSPAVALPSGAPPEICPISHALMVLITTLSWCARPLHGGRILRVFEVNRWLGYFSLK